MKKKVVSALAACALASGLGVAALGPATAASPMVASQSASSSAARPAAAPHIDSQHARTTLAQKHSVGESVPEIVGGFITDHSSGTKYRILTGSYDDTKDIKFSATMTDPTGKTVSAKGWDDPSGGEDYPWSFQIGDGPTIRCGVIDQTWSPGGPGKIVFLNVDAEGEDVPQVSIAYLPTYEDAEFSGGNLVDHTTDRGFRVGHGEFNGADRSAKVQAVDSKRMMLWMNAKENPADYSQTITIGTEQGTTTIKADEVAAKPGSLIYYNVDAGGNIEFVLSISYPC